MCDARAANATVALLTIGRTAWQGDSLNTSHHLPRVHIITGEAIATRARALVSSQPPSPAHQTSNNTQQGCHRTVRRQW
eukprot:4189249-Alexandrium_andersonii.AAC.1